MLKRVLLIFGGTVLGMGAIAFFFWQQATQLPSWYTNQSTTEKPLISETNNPPLGSSEILNKVKDNLAASPQGEVELNAEEINTLIVSELTKSPQNQLQEVLKNTNTQIQNGKISTGAVINLSEITDTQSGQKSLLMDEIFQNVPTLKDRSVYIGVEGKPTIRNRQVTLDDTTRVKLGNISLTIPEVAQRLGIPEAKINQQLAQVQLKLPTEVQGVEIVGDRLVIRAVN